MPLIRILFPTHLSAAATSIHYFALLYVLPTAVVLLAVPALPLRLLGLPVEGLLWIRLLGMVVAFLTYYYINLARCEVTPFFRWTVHTRGIVPAVFALMLAGGADPVLLLFAVGDFAGAVWTFWGLRRDGHAVFATPGDPAPLGNYGS